MEPRWRWVGVAAVGWLAMAPAAGASKTAGIGIQPWVIESAEYKGALRERIVQIDGVFTIRLIQDGWAEIPLALHGATVTGIEITKKTGEAHVVPRGPFYSLMASRKGLYKVHVTCSTMLAQDSQLEGLRFGIPQATFSTLTLSVPRKDVELRQADQLYVERKPDGPHDGATLIAKLGAGTQVDIRWLTRPAAPEKIEPALYGEVFSVAVLEEQLMNLTSMIEYRITQGEVKELVVALPKTLQILNVRGAGIDGWKVAEESERNRLVVSLNFPLKDAVYQLVLEGERPIAPEAGEVALPELTLQGVKQERGQWAVAASGSLEVSAKAAEGVSRIDVKELSSALRASTVLPVVLAFRYHQHPYRAELALTRHADLPVLNAIAERGELVTVISRQGERLTRAVYIVRANKKQFLGVRLPEGAALWSSIVDRRSVKPVEGEGQLLIPLSGSQALEQPVLVELVYFERQEAMKGVGRLMLRGPVLDVPTTVATWRLFTPSQARLLKTSGNLERGAGPVEFMEDSWELAAANGPVGQLAQAGGYAGGKEKDDVRQYVTLSKMTELERSQREDGRFNQRAKKPRQLAAVDRASVGSAGGEIGAGEGWADPSEESETSNEGFRNANLPATRAVESPPDSYDGRDEDKKMGDMVGKLEARMHEAGILPLTIRLPKAGRVYQFSRLLTSQEALVLEASFVTLPGPVGPWPWFGVGLLAFASGGIAWRRTRKA